MLPDKLTHYILLEIYFLLVFITFLLSFLQSSHVDNYFLSLIIFLSRFLLSLAGQITQWNLIFYGTSEPPQKNDPPRYLGNNKKTVVNDLIHNSLDNSQWGFITQDVSDDFFFVCAENSHVLSTTQLFHLIFNELFPSLTCHAFMHDFMLAVNFINDI